MAQTVLAKMAVEISANTAKFNDGLTKASQQTKKFQDGIKQLGVSLVAGFGLIEVGRQIIDVTSQFQKFEAVLTNTLGSNSDAQYALQAIRDFAIKTPFEVKELTAAYVRWANQGLNPTIDKMRMLGDVASSLGAGFEQTAEAFKDLAVGQTKRIEEIGISAQQANGKIQLSFKGVNIEIEKNAQGVQKALETYSQLTGVIGSTEAVAKTLGGQVSNLKDAWDNFLLTIGQSTGGILSYAITGLTNLLTVFSNLSAEIGILSTKLTFWKDVNDLSKETLDYAIKLGKTNAGNSIADVIKQIEGNKTAVQQYASVLTGSMEVQKAFRKEFEKQGESADVVNRLWYAYFRDLKKRAEMEQKQADAAKKSAEQIKKDAEAAIRLAAKQDAEEKARAQSKAQLQIEEIKRNAEKLGLLNLLNRKIDEISSKELLSKNELSVVKQASNEVEKLVQRFNDLNSNIKINIPALGEIQPPKIDTDKLLSQFEEYAERVKNANNEVIRSFQENRKAFNEAFGSAAQQGLADFFNGLSDVANGQISFGDNFLQALSEFMKTFGRNLVALGIAKLGLDNLFKAGPAGAAIAIAAGVALQTAAGAVQKSLAKRSQNLSGGGNNSFSGQTINASAMQNSIQVTGQLVGSGRDLVAVINNTSFDNKVRKGG